MTSSREGKKFTIPSIEDIRNYELAQGSNGPLLFNKREETAPVKSKAVSEHGPREDKATAGGNVEVSMTTTTSLPAAAVTMTTTTYCITANPVQRQNPVVRFIRNIPVTFDDVIPDFVLGKTTCAIFLSIRYHKLHPNYIHNRLKQLGRQYTLRILLLLVDVIECQKTLQELTKIALLSDCTLILAWSNEEAARYLETYKAYENKPPDILKERVESDTTARAIECLTSVKKINKSNATMLIDSFKTMDNIVQASKEELGVCPGLGPQKVTQLHELFHESFVQRKRHKPDDKE